MIFYPKWRRLKFVTSCRYQHILIINFKTLSVDLVRLGFEPGPPAILADPHCLASWDNPFSIHSIVVMFGVCFKVLYRVVLFLSGKAKKRKKLLYWTLLLYFNFNAMAPAWAHAEIVLSSGLGTIYFPAVQVDFMPI